MGEGWGGKEKKKEVAEKHKRDTDVAQNQDGVKIEIRYKEK